MCFNSDRAAWASVFGTGAGVMFGHSPFNIRGDAAVKRIIGAAQEVDKPVGHALFVAGSGGAVKRVLAYC